MNFYRPFWSAFPTVDKDSLPCSPPAVRGKERREVLELILDGVTIDRDNSVQITLAAPIDELVSVESLYLVTGGERGRDFGKNGTAREAQTPP